LLQVPTAAIYRPESATDRFVLMACAGDDAQRASWGRLLPSGTGISGLAFRKRGLVLSPDVMGDERIVLTSEMRDRIARSPWSRGGLAVPLVVHEQLIGMLVAADVTSRVFDEEVTRLARMFADQAAVMLEGALNRRDEGIGTFAPTDEGKLPG
jgi:GAF domain-containing protein